MNKVILIGNITKDLELMTTGSGVDYCRFGIAVQDKYKDEKDNYTTTFLSCVAWKSTAENIVKYFQKGRKIAIVGHIQNRQYEYEGQKRYATDIVVDEFYFVDGKREGNSQKEEDLPLADEIDSGDLPF